MAKIGRRMVDQEVCVGLQIVSQSASTSGLLGCMAVGPPLRGH